MSLLIGELDFNNMVLHLMCLCKQKSPTAIRYIIFSQSILTLVATIQDGQPPKKKVEEGHKYRHVKILSQLKFRIILTQIANSYLEKNISFILCTSTIVIPSLMISLENFQDHISIRCHSIELIFYDL